MTHVGIQFQYHNIFKISLLSKQTTLTRLMTWFEDLGLSLSANKSEIMVFYRKHKNPQVSVRLGQTAL
jgi:hypothetical protein